MMWNKVTVIGCGLIGVSFALAARRAGVCGRLAGWDTSASTLAEALRRGVIDEVDHSFANGDVSTSDLIYLSMPVGEIVGFLRERGGQVQPGALVTDAGSTKQEVCRVAHEQLPSGRRFVGGHPIAGSHLRGLVHARVDLFAGAPYVLTLDENETDRQTLAALETTLKLFGARVVVLTPREHDRAMALVSHLPQIVSGALAAVVNDQPDAEALKNLTGSGYRDMTRLAASSWSVWHDVLATNPAHIAAALDALMKQLASVRDELHDYAERAAGELNTTGALFQQSRRT